jgi:imidazoleglycerol phosphate dehydratase HisB
MPGDEALAPAVGATTSESVATRGDVRCTARVVDLGPRGRIATGLPYLDHMLDQLTAHAQLGVSVGIEVKGAPLEPEKHYSAVLRGSLAGEELERDITELAGQALGGALWPLFGGNGHDRPPVRFLAPLDEGLSEVVLRLHTGEPSLHYAQAPFGSHPPTGRTRVGDVRLILLSGFWAALARSLGASLTVVKVRGDNAHHIVESSFKAFARAVRCCLDAKGGQKRPREGTDAAGQKRAGEEETDVVGPKRAREQMDSPRRASHERNTKETKIAMEVELGGTGGASEVCLLKWRGMRDGWQVFAPRYRTGLRRMHARTHAHACTSLYACMHT